MCGLEPQTNFFFRLINRKKLVRIRFESIRYMAKLCSFNLSCDCSKHYVGFDAQKYRPFYQNCCILKVTENCYRSKFWGYIRGHLHTVIRRDAARNISAFQPLHLFCFASNRAILLTEVTPGQTQWRLSTCIVASLVPLHADGQQ